MNRPAEHLEHFKKHGNPDEFDAVLKTISTLTPSETGTAGWAGSQCLRMTLGPELSAYDLVGDDASCRFYGDRSAISLILQPRDLERYYANQMHGFGYVVMRSAHGVINAVMGKADGKPNPYGARSKTGIIREPIPVDDTESKQLAYWLQEEALSRRPSYRPEELRG